MEIGIFDFPRYEREAHEAAVEAGFNGWPEVREMARISRHNFYDFLVAHSEHRLARVVWLAPTIYGWD